MRRVGGLRELQNQLKREYLLLQRQRRQKQKLKKQIEKQIEDYYEALVEKREWGRVLKQDKLGNSYNYVKELVLEVSKDVELGIEILMHAKKDAGYVLSTLLMQIFYQNFAENDPYAKKITKFALLLGQKISDELTQKFFAQKQEDMTFSKDDLNPILSMILQQFLNLESIQQYFQMLANNVLDKIPSSVRFEHLFLRGGTGAQLGRTYELIENYQSLALQKDNLEDFAGQSEHGDKQARIQAYVDDYKADMIAKAQMMPVCLRVLLYSVNKGIKTSVPQKTPDAIRKLLWQILEQIYFKPFDSNSPAAKRWSQFKYSYFGGIAERIYSAVQSCIDDGFVDRLLERVLAVSEERIGRKEKEGQRKIVINGGCINYQRLYLLLCTIKDNFKQLEKYNIRVANRILKIEEINRNFDFFNKFEDPDTSYLTFTELVCSQILNKKYNDIYSSIYNSESMMVKNMLKQILCDTDFHILPYLKKDTSLKDIFETITREQESDGDLSISGLHYSPQFNIKIKYFVYLLTNQNISEESLFDEMILECLDRQKNNIAMFEKTKMQLLQCLTTVKKAHKSINTQKEAKLQVDNHLKIIKLMDLLQVEFCITAPSTRPEVEKFLKSGSIALAVERTSGCIHSDQKMGPGIPSHAFKIHEAVSLFCDLKEVQIAIETGKDNHSIYDGLCCLIKLIKDDCRSTGKLVNMELSNQLESTVPRVVLREFHDNLVKQKPKIEADIALEAAMEELSFIKPARIRVSAKHSLAQWEQMWEIACKYLSSLIEKKTPIEKIELILEMIEVVKISLHREGWDRDDQQVVDLVLGYCLIRAKPAKIIANLNFIEIFLWKDKLLSKYGGALNKFKNAVNIVKTKKILQFLEKEPEDQKMEKIPKNSSAESQFSEPLLSETTQDKLQSDVA